ncbi:hypothetical protein BMH32_04255 [Leucobacter sp. OLJS4]|uniref:type VII secretion protein EccCa n=1 Tax=unclassified Leucobacter TaxID=2621730 RepID=UPI000C1A50F5|nr:MULTISPECIES: type VII secretion protein EccCa [unclassified Leucobacter]PII82259.1 hypothetical protein BMH25_10185 [Leucobacter sp. OLCALW19]PII88545.1 hypothetical protein BMH26_05695 [Leucobacter sp. OLTLW20]PII94148.1 hypothetical protein BMH27_01775 [Leucobacter sp. OLAS13]PII98279.1 hypothetical protein BMH29_08925 [Leucobacter sp. OLDS2]PIJ03451.1 hypothetical protein BMH31_08330 [Leucobacter sp. OLIS6]
MVKLVHRPARINPPLERPEPRVLAAPPQQGDAVPGGLPLRTLLPVFGSLSSIVMIVVLRANPVMVVIGAVILVVALVGGIGMAVGQRGQAARARRRERERYLDYLENLRAELRESHTRTRTWARVLHPDPVQLSEATRNPEQLWDRRRSDPDFLEVRVGVGVVPWFDLQLPPGANPVQPYDAIMAGEAQSVIRTHSAVAGMPATIGLRGAGTVAIVGAEAETHAIARNLIAQIAVSHAPEDVRLGLAVPPELLHEFPNADLLPHLGMDTWDGPLPARRIAPDQRELLALIRAELAERTARAASRLRNGNRSASSETPLVLVLDHSRARAENLILPEGFSPEQLGITVVTLVPDRLQEPSDTKLRLTVAESGEQVQIERLLPGRDTVEAVPDRLDPIPFETLAARLAPLRLSPQSRSESDEERSELDILQILGVDSLADISHEQWRRRSTRDFLRVPFGTGDDGAPVALDLKESAHGGMGPHGICIGATGSGKSEFLRTLILSLVISHGPDDLAMILVDYKGGTAFTPFQSVPHIAGLMDNLENDAQLIERARASISGEVVRRQRLLKEAGGFASITDYRSAREANPAMPPLPHLFLVIDEFGELLTAQPEFIDLLLQIGRIGRALGIHLLLASQRIEAGKLRGLDTYLSYRIGLRTFSEQESSVILETPDAFHLPPYPGYGYLKVDTTVYTRFKAGYVAGPVPGPNLLERSAEENGWEVFVQPPYNTIEAMFAGDAGAGPGAPAASAKRSLMEESVARLRAPELQTTPVWLPPLPDRLPLFEVVDEHRRAPLQVPIGLLDEPARQSQQPWTVDLTRAGGHFAVIGAPQTGRSTFLRTFAAGIATTHTPKQVTMYGLDLTGAGLARLEDFPHVGGVATRANREQQVRLLEELQHMIDERERLFRVHRIESLSQFRNAHAAGKLPQVVSPDIVLLVDGYGLVRQDFDALADQLADLLTRGSSFGVHLVLALTRWNEVTMGLQPLIGNRVELRLNDPTESTIKRKLSETIRPNQPGRVLTDGQLFAQVALPVIEDVEDDLIGDALTELAQQIGRAWNGPEASPIRLLPEDLAPATLPDAFAEPDGIPIGLRQDTMEPVLLDFAGADQHVLVLGDAGSGKTTLLRQMCAALIDRLSPEELVVALMEPRGRLAGALPDDYLGGHANNAVKAKQLSAALALELDKRQNEGADASLRIVVVIDDYDILSAGGTSPLEPLMPYLASSRDLNFNVVLTRPVAGAARAMFESMVQSVKDTGGTGIILSGERAEGPLWPGVYASGAVPGRGKLVRRGQPPRLVQIANQQD